MSPPKGKIRWVHFIPIFRTRWPNKVILHLFESLLKFRSIESSMNSFYPVLVGRCILKNKSADPIISKDIPNDSSISRRILKIQQVLKKSEMICKKLVEGINKHTKPLFTILFVKLKHHYIEMTKLKAN